MTVRSTSTCTVDGCDESLDARGLCHMHYMRYRRRGMEMPAKTTRTQPPKQYCRVPDCGKEHHAKGWCVTHYRAMTRSRATGDWLEPTYPPLVRYLEDRRSRGIPPEGVPMEGEAA